MVERIKHYCLSEHANNLYKKEAGSSIALARDVADKLNELIDAFNKLYTEKWEKIHEQDGKIRKAVLYMKDNLINSIYDLFETLKATGKLDKIITEAVLSEVNVLLNRSEGTINVLEFGAIGDGLTDDTDAFKKAINHAQKYNKTIVLDGGKTYKISSIEINKHININLNGATIKSNSEDFVIKYNCANTPGQRYVLQNGKIIGNKGIYLRSNLLSVYDLTIECVNLGLETSDCYELALMNIKVIGNGNVNSIGFDLHCTDSSIINCITTNIAKCFKLDNSTNYIYMLHGWNTLNFENSTLLEITSGRECILNDIYADNIINGIVSDCPKITINNFVYAFQVSIGGNNKQLQCFNLLNNSQLELNGGFINYTGDNNTFVLSNKFIVIKNVEDRSGVCNFSFVGTENNVLNIDYEDGVQYLNIQVDKDIAKNLNYVDTFNNLVELPSNTYVGYSSVTRNIDGVDFNLKIPVVFDFVKGTGKIVLYVYHEDDLTNANLGTKM